MLAGGARQVERDNSLPSLKTPSPVAAPLLDVPQMLAPPTIVRRLSAGRATSERRLSATYSAPSEDASSAPAAASEDATATSDPASAVPGTAASTPASDAAAGNATGGGVPWLLRTLSRQSSRSSRSGGSRELETGARRADGTWSPMSELETSSAESLAGAAPTDKHDA